MGVMNLDLEEDLPTGIINPCLGIQFGHFGHQFGDPEAPIWGPGGTILGRIGFLVGEILQLGSTRGPKELRGCPRMPKGSRGTIFFDPILEPNLVPKGKGRFLKTCIWCDTGFNSEGLRLPGRHQKQHHF